MAAGNKRMAGLALLVSCTVLLMVNFVRTFDYPEDASDVTFAHATNTIAKLDKALKGPVMFLEADVSLGYIRRPDNLSPMEEPIMAHPPLKESDISLREWIATVVERGNGSKGVKLDFKSTDVLNASLQILNNWMDQLSFPLWLNADILSGPAKAETVPVDADTFIRTSRKSFPNATLSIGWTTNIFASREDYRYTWNQVWEMVTTIRCAEIEGRQPITFPIRGIFVKNSLPQLIWLVNLIPHSSITVWSSGFDDLDVESLLELRQSLPLSAVFYDLPDSKMKEFQKLKVNVTYEPSTTPSQAWGVLRDTSEPFGCQDETMVSGNTVLYGGDRTIAVFNQKPIETILNITGNLYPYALSDFNGDFVEREGAMAIVLADKIEFWSEGYWTTWQNMTSLAIGVNSPNHSESCCSVNFQVKTLMPEGSVVSDVKINPCVSSEPCLVYTDSSEYNLSRAKELYLGFVFMGERAMILDDININGVPDFFVKPVISAAGSLQTLQQFLVKFILELLVILLFMW